MEPPLTVTVMDEREHRVVLAVVGELDLATAPILEIALSNSAAREVILDLAGLQFMDSTGIRVLVETHNRLDATGRRLALRKCHSLPRRALEVSGLGDFFHLER